MKKKVLIAVTMMGIGSVATTAQAASTGTGKTTTNTMGVQIVT